MPKKSAKIAPETPDDAAPTKPVLQHGLTSKSFADATARYSTTAVLRKLLTDDAERGGIPIRLLSARWLLTHFRKEGKKAARLKHRQWLEREHPEAFIAGETLERVLAEVEHGEYMSKAASGEWRSSRRKIAFPSAMALSHMWLEKAHPDPNARNLRDMWLPAIEWLYSERVRQLGGDYNRARDADGTRLSDEAVLAAADFGLFVDLSSMCQKENDQRTEVEDGLFRHALGSLDVVYAHKGLMSLLSTRVPRGVKVDRTYEDRGWCVAP